ncbi:thiol-disulfide oxidoreductase DCC family protein [Flavobacterium algicola]|uniref:thiol-disulfide oxidoreductase DCC family protein n=1 Tax=Flavobacterium algicola TaxID=556529 RepID=UPI001EFC8C4F|nr:DCC1-like thiol-disulfide oxidoreductase family protein [Flavobacterium algicola]MCG9792756.1 DCC1-like thiol-disulfide oxidoreductase family protein [Flavobacterium algicola]
MLDLPTDKKIIIFDGVCNLCNSAINYIIAHDNKDIFRFVALQSNLGQEILKHIGIDTHEIDSIILYLPTKAYYYKSEAALEIAKDLNGFLPMLSLFRVIPSALSNYIYDCIAKNRYRWYGKKESCMIPTPELQSKFLI